jgi:hypothetical protein
MKHAPDILGAVGAGAITAGVFLLAGLGFALIAGGVFVLIVCVLLAVDQR